MAKPLKAGIIGCGAITERLHAADFPYCEEAELVALCDNTLSKAKHVGSLFAPEARTYSDHKQMLKQEDLDMVTVCLPNYLHARVTIDALKAGCNVLVEKPMATSTAEAQRMLDTAKKHGRLLMVNQSQRVNPVHIKAKEIMDSGIMGKVLHVTAMFGHAGPEYWSPTGTWFFKSKHARFGAAADLGVHKADLVRYLTGKEVAEVSAFIERIEKKRTDVDDNLVSCVKFADGTVGTISASWTVKGASADYTILHCSNGTLQVAAIPGRPLVANLINPACEIDFDPAPPLTTYPDAWGMGVSIRFARACLGLEEPFCTGEEGKKSLEVILAAEKAAKTGKTVKLK